MELSSRRVRIIAVAVLLSDPSMSVMNHSLRVLILSYFLGTLGRFRLGWVTGSRSCCASPLHLPSSIRMWRHVLITARHLVLLLPTL